MIGGWSVAPWLFGLLGVLASLALAGAWRRHALRQQWLDLPGERRLHGVPTPRGGGIAVAAVLLAATPGLGDGAALVAIGLLVTAGAGLIDDLRPLPALPKLGLQCVGALPLALAWPLAPDLLGAWGGPVAAWLLVLALVNFWNFMDGSNGMAATQGLLVGGAMLLASGAAAPEGWLGLALVAGCLGFLPFNLPKARLFLGDVGSFAIGYAVAAMVLMAMSHDPGPALRWLLLPSVVLLDAGLTLLGRLWRRQRFWLAHREHVYQRAVLHGWSHGAVCAVYAAWTLVAAVLVWALAGQPLAPQALALVLAAALAVAVRAWAGQRWATVAGHKNDMESC